jgi:DNA-directed RNA polymerase subunit M/transcription elongation factor TFIIS
MENIANIIKESKNRHEVLKKLNWDCNTSGYKKLNKYIVINNIDISHFETKQEQYERTLKICKKIKGIPLTEILISGSTFENRSAIKKKLYAAGLKERKCEKCGQNEIWYGQHITLILDHINGIHDDNRLENLQILCPN